MAREFVGSFYQSKEWKKVRAYILIRDKYKCVRCGNTGTLEVHHIERLSPQNIYNPSVTLNEKNLITLCRECHFKEHESERVSNIKSDECMEGYVFNADGYLVPSEAKDK